MLEHKKFTKQQRRGFYTLGTIFLLHLSAVILMHVNTPDVPMLYSYGMTILRSVILLVIFGWWGIVIRYRIIMKSTRKYLMFTVALMCAWIFMRMCKYVIFNETISRYLWYCYYIPIIFLPILSIFVSLSIGQRESYVLPKTKWIPISIGTVLVLSVFTNDLHQYVFSFPYGFSTFDSTYHHEILYYIILVWVVLCMSHALIMLLLKCRIQHTGKLLFLLASPIIMVIIYCILYIRNSSLVIRYLPDMTVVVCYFTITLYELCILNNLIASNTQYEELFEANTLPMFITDENYHIFSQSRNAFGMDDPMLKKMNPDTYILKDTMCIYTSDIRRGHVYWTQDVSKIIDVINELEDVSESLQERHAIVQEELRTNQQRIKLEEVNRIYEAMQLQTAGQIDRMMELVDQLENTDNQEEEHLIAYEMAIRGAYFKRRNNLLFIAETQDDIPAYEVTYCLNESMYALNLNHVQSSVWMNVDGNISLENALKLYDVFQEVIESVFEHLESIAVKVDEDAEKYDVNISLSLHPGKRICFPETVEAEQEENEYVISYSLKKNAGVSL